MLRVYASEVAESLAPDPEQAANYVDPIDDEGEPDVEAEQPHELTAADPSAPTAAEISVFQRKLSEAKDEYAEASLQVMLLQEEMEELKERIKEQQDLCKALATRLRTIMATGQVQLPIEHQIERNTVPAPAPPTEKRPVLAEPKQPEPIYVKPGEKLPLNWEDMSVEYLHLDSIKGVGQRAKEAIIETCPTMGMLEKLRAGKGLTSIHGVGRALADRLEDALISWLTKYRDRQEFEAAGASIAVTPDDVADLDIEHPISDPLVSSKAKPKSAEKTAAPAAEKADEPEDEAILTARRADWLRAEGNFELARKMPYDAIWDSGASSYENGDAVTECPWTAGERQDAWICGWLHMEAEFVANATAQPELKASDDEEAEPQAEPQAEEAQATEQPQDADGEAENPFAQAIAESSGPKMQVQPPQRSTEVQNALDALETLLEMCEDVPERGEDFASSVSESARDMIATIEENDRVTEGQLRTIDNWTGGISRWLD